MPTGHIRDMLGLGKEDFENFKSCTKAAADRFLLLELTAMDQPIELGRAIQEIVSCNPEIRMKSPAHTRALKCYLLRQHSQRRFYRFIRKKDIQKSDSRREQENIREAKPRAAAYRGVYTSSSPERKSNSSSSCDSISDSDSSDMSEDDSDDAMNPGSSLYDWSDDDDDDDDGPSNDTHSSAKDSVVGKADAIHHGRRDKGQNPHLEQNSAKTSTCVSRYERVGHALGKRRRTQTMDKVKAECLSANQPNLKGMDQAQVPSQHVDNPPQLAEKPATADISPEGSGSAQPVVRARLVQEQASSSEEKFSAVRAFLNAMSPSMQYMLPAFVEFGFTDGNSLRYVAEKSTEDIEVVIRRIQKVLNLDSSVERKVSELDVIRLTDAFSSYK
ncbi:hypothetical protein FA15DRAFT_133383 [Coprinopsis marcescibilis]|uniref:Uncharacterized protein n=1 Tax=Coprinopsis marcescibilis TaxID=230819 RepID=A0A5C3LGZ8_COPMA|nr:hypothetical protein FA15DRAFT_133383 [Coprinopsis marcescibilis]